MKNKLWILALLAFSVVGIANVASAQTVGWTSMVGGKGPDGHPYYSTCPVNPNAMPIWGFQTYANTRVVATRPFCFDWNTGPWIGGSGGNYVDQLCNQNHAVRGFDGYADPLITRIRYSCRTWDSSSTHLTTFAGGSGGNFLSVRCASGYIAMAGIMGYADTRVTGLMVKCNPW